MRDRSDWKLSKAWRDMQHTQTSNQPTVLGMNHYSPMLILLSIMLGLTLVIFVKIELQWVTGTLKKLLVSRKNYVRPYAY